MSVAGQICKKKKVNRLKSYKALIFCPLLCYFDLPMFLNSHVCVLPVNYLIEY